jgi:hypothetical protein
MPAIDIQELRPTPTNRSTWTLPTYFVPERFDGYRTSRSLSAGTRNGYCADIGARLSFYKSPEDIDEQVAAAVANGSQITFLTACVLFTVHKSPDLWLTRPPNVCTNHAKEHGK